MTDHVLCLGPCRPPAHGGPRPTTRGAHVCDVCADHMTEDLTNIHDTWADLAAALTRGQAGMTQRVTGSTTPGLVLDERVSEVMREAGAWTWFVTRLVVDERRIRPPRWQATPDLALWLGKWHVGWLIAHPDPQMAASFAIEARAHALAARRAAYPSGVRKVTLDQLQCTEHTTTDAGAQLPCTGKMFVLIAPDATTLPDLICETNPLHRVPPAVWSRATWRRVLPEAAAVELTRKLAG